MGKSKPTKGNSKEEAPKAQCYCPDPYKCTCGNRPPRPSKGHKWDPEAQMWGGKGHKQKGASGQVATVSQGAVTTHVGKTKVEQWQRLPSQLLEEHCKRQKRPPPKFQSRERRAGKFKYRVILPDSGDPKKDLFYEPSVPVENEEQAKEESALLALVHLTPNMPHERKLPEPYKTTWLLALESRKAYAAASTSLSSSSCTKGGSKTNDDSIAVPGAAPKLPTQGGRPSTSSLVEKEAAAAKPSSNLVMAQTYTSLADMKRQQEQKRKDRNARIRRHEAVRLANQNVRVFMSAQIRNQIRQLLRGESVLLDDVSDDEAEVAPQEEDASESDGKAYVVERFLSEGFTRRQIEASFRALASKAPLGLGSEEHWEPLYETCLRWLLSHLNEDELPAGFNPQQGALEVIVPSSNSGATQSRQTLSSSGDSILAARYGLLPRDAAQLQERARLEQRSVEEKLWDELCRMSGVPSSGGQEDARVSAENQDHLNEELEALRIIFSSEYSSSRTSERYTTVSIRLPEFDKILDIVLEDGLYPMKRPCRALVRGGWSLEGMGVAFHLALLCFVSDLALGELVVYDIYGHVQTLLQSKDRTIVPLYPDMSTLNSNLSFSPEKNDSIDETTLQTHHSHPISFTLTSERHKRPRRPRERGSFWSVLPAETPSATPFPAISQQLQDTRRSLPSAAARSHFLSLLQRSSTTGRVVAVSGETGCGKSTQLPQYILEEAPSTAKIVVTQPRRLAATGVATRVANERGESRPGMDSVGYVVRGDSAICQRSRLVFCTTGVLLRQLQTEGALSCITHIIVDEVHERQLDTDVVLALLKRLLPEFPALKVILMSATMDSDRLASYWGNSTPTMTIPGRTFPVTDYFLDDVLSLLRYVPSKKGRNSRVPEEDCHLSEDLIQGGDLSDSTKRDSVTGVPFSELVKRVDETSVQYDILATLVKHLIASKSANDGSILVFLPGAPEINKATETIKRCTPDMPILLLPLHGGLRPKEQARVFRPAPQGVTKVVLSTNIAQTSVTIEDCLIVIDTAREKQSSYDPTNRMPLLVETFASKADLKQRRGRAGRVRSGVCYKLVSKATFARLKEHGEPEILRCALDQTLLSLLFMGVEDGSGVFLQTLIDPPEKQSLEAAVFSLIKIGAIHQKPDCGLLTITSLGMLLAGIPAPPTVAKLMIMGSILGCRFPSVAMAAGISVGRSPFLRIESNPRKKAEDGSIQEYKNSEVLSNRADLIKKIGNSDHAIFVALLREWKNAGHGSGKKRLCERYGLSFTAMQDMESLAHQLDASLASIGFAPTDDSNRNADSWKIVRATVVSAMSPCQLVKVVRPAAKYAETAEGAQEKNSEARELKFFIRTDVFAPREKPIEAEVSNAKEERVFMHPSSSNFAVGTFRCPWLVYHSLVRTSKPFLRDVTECTAYALLLFGGELEVKASAEDAEVVIDGWAKVNANSTICALIGGLREKVDNLLSMKIQEPTYDVAASTEMKLIVKLVKCDGHY